MEGWKQRSSTSESCSHEGNYAPITGNDSQMVHCQIHFTTHVVFIHTELADFCFSPAMPQCLLILQYHFQYEIYQCFESITITVQLPINVITKSKQLLAVNRSCYARRVIKISHSIPGFVRRRNSRLFTVGRFCDQIISHSRHTKTRSKYHD